MKYYADLTAEQFHQASAYNQALPDYMRQFASGEVLANAAYYLTDAANADSLPFKISLLETSGSWQSYHVHALHVQTTGLHGFVLTPTDTTNTDVKVTFRGTYDMASFYRDFELLGPGAASFAFEKRHILAQLETIIDSVYGDVPITMTISGHSLGASDAENLAAAVVESVAEANGFETLTALSVYSFNSPGIPHSVTDKSVEDAILIKNENPDFHFEAHYGKVGEDVIQQLGDNHFLNGIDPSLADIDLIEVEKVKQYNEEIDYLHAPIDAIQKLFAKLWDAHALGAFFSPDENGHITHEYPEYIYLNNQDPNHYALMAEEFSDKAFYFVSAVKNVLWTIKLPVDGYHWALDKAYDFSDYLSNTLWGSEESMHETLTTILRHESPLGLPESSQEHLTLQDIFGEQDSLFSESETASETAWYSSSNENQALLLSSQIILEDQQPDYLIT